MELKLFGEEGLCSIVGLLAKILRHIVMSLFVPLESRFHCQSYWGLSVDRRCLPVPLHLLMPISAALLTAPPVLCPDTTSCVKQQWDHLLTLRESWGYKITPTGVQHIGIWASWRKHPVLTMKETVSMNKAGTFLTHRLLSWKVDNVARVWHALGSNFTIRWD